jgi:hypothetical protein
MRQIKLREDFSNRASQGGGDELVRAAALSWLPGMLKGLHRYFVALPITVDLTGTAPPVSVVVHRCTFPS